MAYQGKTLTDIITVIRGLIGEPLAGRTGGAASLRFKNTLLCTLFNWAQEEVAIESRWQKARSMKNVTAGVVSVSMPTACAVLLLVEWKDSSDLWLPLQEVNERENTLIEGGVVSGDEPVYRVEGSSIVLDPAFTTSKTNGLRFTYIPRPSKLASATNSCVLSPTGARAAIWRVVEFCRFTDEKPDLVQIAKGNFFESALKAGEEAIAMREQRLHTRQDVMFAGAYRYRNTIGRR